MGFPVRYCYFSLFVIHLKEIQNNADPGSTDVPGESLAWAPSPFPGPLMNREKEVTL